MYFIKVTAPSSWMFVSCTLMFVSRTLVLTSQKWLANQTMNEVLSKKTKAVPQSDARYEANTFMIYGLNCSL